MKSNPMRILPLIACGLVLAGCGSSNQTMSDTVHDSTAISSDSGQRTLGVNSYLWHSSLDTLSFMPLASADPFGGVIITDWYTPADASGERFKATAYILGRDLRSDGLRVSVFRQVNQGGRWVDAPVSPVVQADIENKVLDRARKLREQSGGRS